MPLAFLHLRRVRLSSVVFRTLPILMLFMTCAVKRRSQLSSGLSHAMCGEGELVGGVHTLVWRSVQVYHELLELEEEDKGREEVQEIERESQVEEKRSDDHGHVDEVKDSTLEPQCVCG